MLAAHSHTQITLCLINQVSHLVFILSCADQTSRLQKRRWKTNLWIPFPKQMVTNLVVSQVSTLSSSHPTPAVMTSNLHHFNSKISFDATIILIHLIHYQIQGRRNFFNGASFQDSPPPAPLKKGGHLQYTNIKEVIFEEEISDLKFSEILPNFKISLKHQTTIEKQKDLSGILSPQLFPMESLNRYKRIG